MSDSSQFTINLAPTGNADATYRVRIQNEPGQYQRRHLIDRSSKLKVQGDMIHVVHGRLSPGGPRATLIMAVFRFMSASQRIRKAEILLKFSSLCRPGSDLDPEVTKIAYENIYFWNPTVADRTVTYGAKVVAEAGGCGGGGGVEIGWQQTQSYKISDRAVLIGSIRFEGRDHGAKNAAEWTLKENRMAKDGIPGVFVTALLVKRKTDDPFSMTVEVDAEASIMSKIKSQWERLAGGKDAPVLFDPSRPTSRENTRSDIDRNNLGMVDLRGLSELRGAEQIPITAMSPPQPSKCEAIELEKSQDDEIGEILPPQYQD